MIRLAYPQFTEGALSAVMEILSGGNLVQGKQVAAFENALAGYLGLGEVVVVSSGTAALHLSLVAMGIGPGDEVVVPSFTFPAVANVVELTGASPVFADVMPDDFCIDPLSVASVITRATKAIIPVHQFGNPAQMEKIHRLAAVFNLFVLEDAACALGTKTGSVYAGTTSDAGCFSFHPRKILTTGEGGAVFTNNRELALKIRQLRNHGMSPNDLSENFSVPGFNYRMTEIQAALGADQMISLETTLAQYALQAEIYNQKLNGDVLHPANEDHTAGTPCYQTYFRMLKNPGARDALLEELRAHHIECNFGAYSIPELPYYRNRYSIDPDCYRVASAAHRGGVALPIGPHLEQDDILRIAELFNTITSNEKYR
jgi:perosamine synthetase